jgi:hypothetical protein
MQILGFKFKIRPNIGGHPFNMFFEIEKCVKTGFRIFGSLRFKCLSINHIFGGEFSHYDNKKQ